MKSPRHPKINQDVRLASTYRLTIEDHLSFIGRNKTSQQIKNGSLARPIGPEYAHDLTATNAQIDVFNGMQTTKVFI